MNNFQEQSLRNTNEEVDGIDLKNIFVKSIAKWHWFVVSLILALVIAVLYIQYSAPIYKINAKVLINDNEKSSGLGGSGSSGIMDFGSILGGKNSVDNETEVLKTRFLMDQVVRELGLNIVYSEKRGWTTREIYQAPFRIEILSPIDTIKATKINLEIVSEDKIIIKTNHEINEVKWGQKFLVPSIGFIRFTKNTFVPQNKSKEFLIKVTSVDERVSNLMRQLSVAVTNKQVTIIDLGLSYPIPQKGEDILNTLIKRYIKTNLDDKNVIADSTTNFIRKRLSIIAGELGDVESKVENFKQDNRLADMSEQGKLLVQSSVEFQTELAKAETQINILSDLENYLEDENKNKRVFPTSLVPQDMVFSGLMEQYNSLLVERDKQLLSVTEESPFIRNLDSQISGLRQGILANLKNTKNTFVITAKKLRAQLSKSDNQISGVPKVEKDYLKLARNQQIKQELYIFLMRKAEETAISKTSNISIAKTIDPPKADGNPMSPKRNIVYLIAFVLGLTLPIGVVLLADVLNTTVSSKEDITSQTVVPIIGEISHNGSDDNLIVANQGRSAISEQFRALRTNLSFYLKNENENVILLTSSMSGEGKSFTAINLGNILALAGKKVLLMELDLRKPGLSAKLGVANDIGFSNFTIDKSIETEHIIKPLSINKNMFIISSGPLPPNPAEVLMSENIPKLIEELKKRFDYIIMDAPPIGIITDAQLLAAYAHVTIYLVRQKVTQKTQLRIVDDLYKTGKMKNIGIVVNDIVNKIYGYGYGYGNYGENEEKSFLDKLKQQFKRN